MPALGTFSGGSARAYGRGTSGLTVPVTLSLIGYYTLSSVTATQWQDTSGAGNHATLGGGPALATVSPGNGSTLITQVLTGTATTHTVQWPAAILPATYTLFHVTRYTGGSNQRIYTSSNTNWLSGHWAGLSGQYYQNGWLTNNVTNYYGNNWFITTDQINNVRTNAITRGTAGGASTGQMSINIGQGTETSTWQTVECIVYNRVLSAAEYTSVESYLATKFGITLNT